MNTIFILFAKSPKIIWIFAFFFLLLSIFMTPQLLIGIGILEMSLTSTLANVKDLAMIEVALARIIFSILSIMAIIVCLLWQKILHMQSIEKLIKFETPSWFYNSDKIINKTSFFGLLSLVFIGIYLIFGSQLISADILMSINIEDGFIESGTAILFFISSLFAIIIAIKSVSFKSRMIMHLIFAFGFFLIAGEEISWGQRIFGFETIGALEGINVQNENNLHNLLGYSADHLAILTVFFYGVLVPFFMHFYPILKKIAFKIGLPVPSLGLAWCFLFTSLIHEWTIGRILTKLPYLRYAEVREFLTAIMFLLVLFESYGKYKKSLDILKS